MIGVQGKWQELVSILIGVCHLHQDLLYVFVGYFHRAIHLGEVGNRILVFDFELFAKLLDHFPIQIISVIYNQFSWYTVAANDVLFQESSHHGLGDAFVGSGFHTIGKVIDGHQDILMSI